jgi:hypothetical protein
VTVKRSAKRGRPEQLRVGQSSWPRKPSKRSGAQPRKKRASS